MVVLRLSMYTERVLRVAHTHRDSSPPTPLLCRCTYYIGVNGYGGNSSYVVTASTRTGAPEALSLNVPVTDIVPGGLTNSYFVSFDRTFTTLNIQLTPAYGDPVGTFVMITCAQDKSRCRVVI